MERRGAGDRLKAFSISIPLGAEAVDAALAGLRPSGEELERWVRNSSRVQDESEDPRSLNHRTLSVAASENNEPWIPDRSTSSLPDIWTASLTPDMVIERLDPRFFTPDFDPTRYFLEVQLTQEIFENRFHEFFQRNIAEKDVEKDMIMRKLASEVEKNYEELLNGLRQLNQTDLDLARAIIDITNSRRRLQNAQYMLEQFSMKIISLHQRKQQLQAMKDALKKLADLKGMVERMESCAQQGAFSEAATLATQVRDVVQTPAFNQFHVAQHLYRRVQQILPQLNERVDKSLYRVCSRRFTPAEYAEVVRSYLLLEHLRQDFEPPRQESTEEDGLAQADRSANANALYERIHQYIAADIDNCCRTAIIEQLMQSGDYDEQSLLAASDFPIEVLYAKVQPMQLVLCAVRTCELLAEVIHTYFLITQWHRRPFDPRNQDPDFLHSAQDDEMDGGGGAEHDDTATDAGTPSPAADKQSQNAKLAEIYQQLLMRRGHIWAHAQRGLTNMLNSVQATSTIPFDEFLVVMWACDTFGAIGKEFCNQDSRALQSCMRIKSVQYFHHFHSESVTVLKQMLEREPWRPVPVEVAELGGIDGMIAMNGRRGAVDVQRSSHFNLKGLHVQRDLRVTPCILEQFHRDGNPFSVAEDTTQGPIDVMAALLRETSPVPTSPARSPTKRSAGNSAVVTQAVLNGVVKYTGKYLAMMRVMKPAAADIFAGLCQLYDIYLLAVFVAFVSEDVQKLVLQTRDRPLNEAPAPRDQLSFEALLHYLEKVVPALVEVAEEDEEDGEEEKKKTDATLTERLAQFRSSIVLETDLDLAQSVVAAESAVYILSLLKDATPHLLLYLPGSYHGLIDDYTRDASHAADQLRTLVYRSASRLLISPQVVIMEIDKINWDTKELRAEPHDYVQDVTNRCQRIWDALIDEGSPLAQVPEPAKEQVWLEVCQTVFDTILEGFSKARKVSTEGKASMTMDLQALHSGVNAIHLCRPPRGKEYVTGYLRASYFNEDDLMSWIQQNYEQYAFRHVASLLQSAMGSVLKKKKLKDSLTQVEEMYRSYLESM